jgi:endonuclease I
MMMQLKKAIKLSAILLSWCSVQAQAPAGYYNSANGLSGTALKSALHNIITSGHTAIAWVNTWSAFNTTDIKPNGNVWDIYSWKPSGTQPYEYFFGSDQCGTYNSEGDCFNREHTWPQGFFDGTSSGDAYAKTDLHHLYASDGWVNNARANFPFDKVTSGATTYQQGCKLGNGSGYAGYTGKVFEPIDSLKGDIARGLLYMSTRYLNDDAGWSSWPMANGANLTSDATTILLAWHQLDPVSGKEISRNNAIYNLQGNRNPFVDEPEYVNCIWGTGTLCSTLSVANSVAPHKISFYVENNILHLSNVNTNDEYCIFTIAGQALQNGKQQQNISLDKLAQGVYILQVLSKATTQSYLFTK